MNYVYVIKNGKEVYIGYTNNLEKRLSGHNLGYNPSTNRKSGSWQLVYAEKFARKDIAQKRERFFKTGDGREVLRRKGVIIKA